jgi:site-specific DNA-methyltransferase (adenine-specific)
MTPYYERDGITIYCGECGQVMVDVLEADSIDLTVTSPPYDDLREYNGYVFDFEAIAGQLWRVTAQGGVVVWVVGDATANGSETLNSFRQALYFKQLGFNAHDTMIYKAAGVGAKGSHKSYWQAFEFMFVFSKAEPKTINLIRDKPNTNAGLVHGPSGIKHNELKSRMANGYKTQQYGIRENVWLFYTGNTNGDDLTIHPAPFPEALARDHIISWSNPGDLVLDPMVGSGTTLKMAQQLGRRAIGIEISEEYCRIAVDRLRQPSFWSIPEPAQNGKDKAVQRPLFVE